MSDFDTLKSKTVAQLKAEAKKLGIPIPPRTLKADLIQLIIDKKTSEPATTPNVSSKASKRTVSPKVSATDPGHAKAATRTTISLTPIDHKNDKANNSESPSTKPLPKFIPTIVNVELLKPARELSPKKPSVLNTPEKKETQDSSIKVDNINTPPPFNAPRLSPHNVAPSVPAQNEKTFWERAYIIFVMLTVLLFVVSIVFPPCGLLFFVTLILAIVSYIKKSHKK